MCVLYLVPGAPGALAALPAHLEEGTQPDFCGSKAQLPGLLSSLSSDRLLMSARSWSHPCWQRAEDSLLHFVTDFCFCSASRQIHVFSPRFPHLMGWGRGGSPLVLQGKCEVQYLKYLTIFPWKALCRNTLSLMVPNTCRGGTVSPDGCVFLPDPSF